jgi:hypothetical protein
MPKNGFDGFVAKPLLIKMNGSGLLACNQSIEKSLEEVNK